MLGTGASNTTQVLSLTSHSELGEMARHIGDDDTGKTCCDEG